mmetsp:Transcript_64285/g.139896  ORF Transcript_64285/g.139896 Transcript_64285/m.139896 type:complete len:508 (+) Transcript_64285:46-1569(+)
MPSALYAASCAWTAPSTLHVVGREVGSENADICGEYACAGTYRGRALYRKTGSTTAMYFYPPMRRWLIDRQGVSESEVCVAFADDQAGAEHHPACAELLWHVWDAAIQAHLPDPEVLAVDAPAMVSLVGRLEGRENCALNGEYDLVGAHHGRPAYRQRLGDAVLKFNAQENRWLLAVIGSLGNVCSAYADADCIGHNARHPGCVELEWIFWESWQKNWAPDPEVRVLTAPSVIHVLGRPGEEPTEGSASQLLHQFVFGTYQLAGAREGRPVYVRPGTRTVIRHSPASDRWLIDTEGLTEPSLLSKLYQWILNGDASTASERCTAYAEACGTAHPGYAALQWQVWDPTVSRHATDVWMRATTAPLAVRVSGREQSRENADLNGVYNLVGTHLGRPAYHKEGTTLAIRYYSPAGRWVIDRHGLRTSDECVAYAAGPADAEHPAGSSLVWHVYENTRGAHLADPSVSVTEAEAPAALRSRIAEQIPIAVESKKDIPNSARGSRWLGLFGG